MMSVILQSVSTKTVFSAIDIIDKTPFSNGQALAFAFQYRKFLSFIGTYPFPYVFCGTRWLEDETGYLA